LDSALVFTRHGFGQGFDAGRHAVMLNGGMRKTKQFAVVCLQLLDGILDAPALRHFFRSNLCERRLIQTRLDILFEAVEIFEVALGRRRPKNTRKNLWRLPTPVFNMSISE
jgi:hypothetical protein